MRVVCWPAEANVGFTLCLCELVLVTFAQCAKNLEQRGNNTRVFVYMCVVLCVCVYPANIFQRASLGGLCAAIFVEPGTATTSEACLEWPPVCFLWTSKIRLSRTWNYRTVHADFMSICCISLAIKSAGVTLWRFSLLFLFCTHTSRYTHAHRSVSVCSVASDIVKHLLINHKRRPYCLLLRTYTHIFRLVVWYTPDTPASMRTVRVNVFLLA